MKSIQYLIIALLFTLLSCGGEKSVQNESTETAAEELSPEYVGEEITYSTDSTTMNGYFAYDKNDTVKRPGVLVIHEWWGHNDYARKRADMLAELGYVALAVDMYGDGQTAEHPDDAMGFVMQVVGNLDESTARFDKAMETLKAHPGVDPEKIGAIGYCFGGTLALSMANAGADLDAVAAFHSGLELPIQPEEGGVKALILVCNGADDPMIPLEHVDAFKASMDNAGARYEYVSYEGAVHSFTNPIADSVGAKFQMPLAYNAEADKDSWEKLQRLFEEAFTN